MSSTLREFWQALCHPKAKAREFPLPQERSLVFDVLAEGYRKHTINLLTEFDTAAMRGHMAMGTEKISVTCYVAKALTLALQEQPHMQAYLNGRNKRVIFEEIDLAFMVERELKEGESQPLHFIVRNAGRKSPQNIQQALRQAQTAPIGEGGPLTKLELAFFRLPKLLRKPIWFWIRHDPYVHKQLLGTVGITSMGMHARGYAIVQPVSPMSLTLSIGGSAKHWIREHNEFVERELIQLNLTADHAVIDGAPLMRFAARLVELLEKGHPELMGL